MVITDPMGLMVTLLIWNHMVIKDTTEVIWCDYGSYGSYGFLPMEIRRC